MANMSYVQFENTSKDMQQCVDTLGEVNNLAAWYANLNQYEREGLRSMFRSAQQLLEVRDELGDAL